MWAHSFRGFNPRPHALGQNITVIGHVARGASLSHGQQKAERERGEQARDKISQRTLPK